MTQNKVNAPKSDPQRHYYMYCRVETAQGIDVCNACLKEAETDKEKFIRRAMGICEFSTKPDDKEAK
jgi:hypothetical protein